jgi:serine O-acetyltransferase
VNAAVKLHRIAHSLFGIAGLRWGGKLVYWLNKVLTSSDIDPRCQVAEGVRIPHPTGVVIGETAVIGTDAIIMAGVVIGARSWDKYKRHATVGARVQLGAGAKLLGPIVVGDDARVGANAVVIEDVPAGATVVGVPARVVSGTDEVRP